MTLKNETSHMFFIIKILILIIILTPPTSTNAGDFENKIESLSKEFMLQGIYCDRSYMVMKTDFHKNPEEFPWNATGRVKKAYAETFDKLDFNGEGARKSVEIGKITQNESNFIQYRAIRETQIWLDNANKICSHEIELNQKNQCLVDLNSEVFKCLTFLRQRVDLFLSTNNH